jgi:hypothetical protein
VQNSVVDDACRNFEQRTAMGVQQGRGVESAVASVHEEPRGTRDQDDDERDAGTRERTRACGRCEQQGQVAVPGERRTLLG